MKVLKYKSIGKGYLLASFDLEVPKMAMRLYGLTLFQKDGRRWISMPSQRYEKDGETKFFPYVQFLSRDLHDAFTKQALDAIDEYAMQSKEEQKAEEDDYVPF